MSKDTIAIIKTGGKQYVVAAGDTLLVEKLPGEGGISFAEVLLSASDNDVKIGAPNLDGAKVEGEILGQTRGKKVMVVKYKQKSRYLRRAGHRQTLSRVKITKV